MFPPTTSIRLHDGLSVSVPQRRMLLKSFKSLRAVETCVGIDFTYRGCSAVLRACIYMYITFAPSIAETGGFWFTGLESMEVVL